MKRSLCWFVFVTSLVLTAAFWGQRALAQPGSPPPSKGEFKSENRDAKREHRRGEFEGLRQKKLMEELGLTEEQSAKLDKIIKDSHQKKNDLEDKKRDQVKKIEDLLKVPKPDENALKKEIATLRSLAQSSKDLKRQEFDEVSKHLSVTQQAKYLVFKHQFRERMRGLRDRRHMDRGERGRPGPGHEPHGPPEDDEGN